MRIALLLSLIILTIASFGQIPNWTYLKLIAGKSTDLSSTIQIDKKNNYYIIGTFNNVTGFGVDSLIVDCKGIPPPQPNAINGFLLRYDSARMLNLKLTISNGLIGEAVVDDNSNIIVSGAINYGATGDGFIRKFDESGNIIWTKYVQSISENGLSGNDVITSLDISKDGSMVISGFSYGTQVSIFGTIINGPINFITKLNSQGNVSWIHHFSSTLGVGIYKVRFDQNGEVLVAGNERDIIKNEMSGIIGKLSGSTGTLIWKKAFPSSPNYVPLIKAIGSNYNSYIFGGDFGGQLKVGDSIHNSQGNLDFILIKTDTSGNIIWTKQGGSDGKDRLYNIYYDSNATTYLTGGFSDGFKFNNLSLTAKGNTDIYIISVDSSGNTIWQRGGGSNIPGHTNDLFYDEYGAGISIDSKKQIHIVGTTIGSGNFGSLVFNAPEEAGQNVFWLTLGEFASTVSATYPCNIAPPIIDSTQDFSINVYPNPFSTTLIITNNEQKNVVYQILLANPLGQTVSNITLTGSTVTLRNLHTLIKGVYFLSIQVADYKKIFKIVKQ